MYVHMRQLSSRHITAQHYKIFVEVGYCVVYTDGNKFETQNIREDTVSQVVFRRKLCRRDHARWHVEYTNYVGNVNSFT